MQRRQFIRASAAGLVAGALTGCAGGTQVSRLPVNHAGGKLIPIQARPDRIIATNVCTRPFRMQGPRNESEKLGNKTIVHNYGHGGSGWSLSWGAAELAQQMASLTGDKTIAVLGCGAIGLTTAIQAQRKGMKVTIYAKERPPYVRSSFATGIWSPDSRIVSATYAATFASTWEQMARTSFRKYQTLMGLPGTPVEWARMFQLSDTPFDDKGHHGADGEPDYPDFSKTLIRDITPQPVMLSDAENPFSVAFARRYPLLMFNISAYSRLLTEEFLSGGGDIVYRELTDKQDFANFDENTIINCTGYGARALLDDDSILPVRGQTCKLIPQPEVTYGVQYFSKKVSFYPRRDGLLVQTGGENDFGNPDAVIDPAESIGAVERLADLMAGMKSRKS